MDIRFSAIIDDRTARNRLYSLLTPGILSDHRLVRHINRLHNRYQTYAALYPEVPWDVGLTLTNRMRALTELYLPINELRLPLTRLVTLACRCKPVTAPATIEGCGCWLDILHRLSPCRPPANPALLLEHLMSDETYRIRFLFELSLPTRHGEQFHRYPSQQRYLREWLKLNSSRYPSGVKCLDAACGTGQGTYDLAEILLDHGSWLPGDHVHGCSIEPLEVLAAASSFFPHDPVLEKRFREAVTPLLARIGATAINFSVQDVTEESDGKVGGFDVITCNGLLGGPACHTEENLMAKIGWLSRQLRRGGLLLAADKFHDGWKRKCPPAVIAEIMGQNGLKPCDCGEGLAAVKP